MEGFPRRGWEPSEDFNILGNIFAYTGGSIQMDRLVGGTWGFSARSLFQIWEPWNFTSVQRHLHLKSAELPSRFFSQETMNSAETTAGKQRTWLMSQNCSAKVGPAMVCWVQSSVPCISLSSLPHPLTFVIPLCKGLPSPSSDGQECMTQGKLLVRRILAEGEFLSPSPCHDVTCSWEHSHMGYFCNDAPQELCSR